NSTNIYSAATGQQSYSWSITGNGTISGSTTGQTVTVIAGANCNAPFTLTQNVTGVNGCTSVCNASFNVRDSVPPTIGGQGINTTIECTVTPLFTAPTASDVCSGATVNQVGGDVTGGNSC